MKPIVRWVSCAVISLLIYSGANALPMGSYQQTCQSCRTYQRMGAQYLFCQCLDRNQFRRATWLRLEHCRLVANQNGSLFCAAYDHRRPHHWRRHDKIITVSAGPIWSNANAAQKCPLVCARVMRGSAQWTGQWHTTRYGQNSVCQCRVPWHWSY